VKRTEQTLLEQMRITEFEIENRKSLFGIGNSDIEAVLDIKGFIDQHLDSIVDRFYSLQTQEPEISLLIGDSDTLKRLTGAQRRYLTDLFSGIYDIEYVNSRLRIGLVHKRIGVEPKLYLSAIQTLKSIILELFEKELPNSQDRQRVVTAVEKLFMFDISLVFDTYIRSLVSEVEVSKERSEQYATVLEDKVRERTLQLEMLSKTDALTGLLNVRHFEETLTLALRGAQRRQEVITLAYLDVNDFKTINDTQGHQRGDQILKDVSEALKESVRQEDQCFRYGGDEFCIIMTRCNVEQAYDVFSHRFNHELSLRSPKVSVSVGYAQTGPVEYISPKKLIQEADSNMYRQKQQKKGQRDAAPVETQS
jgi:diguanylate cyclase